MTTQTTPAVTRSAAPVPSRNARRARIAAVHETAVLLLAAASLWSAADQLRTTAGWGLWAPPLLAAAAVAAARAGSIWIGPPLPLACRRAALWGALALATPTALATMTTIDFSALAACQLLLVAGVLAELPTKRRVVGFLWAVPSTAAIGLLLYHSSL